MRCQNAHAYRFPYFKYVLTAGPIATSYIYIFLNKLKNIKVQIYTKVITVAKRVIKCT